MSNSIPPGLYTGAVGFLGAPQGDDKPVSYDVNIKKNGDASPQMKKLWAGVNHVISILYGALSPLSSAINYGVSKGALWSSFGGNNTTKLKKARQALIKNFEVDNLQRTIHRFKANNVNEHNVQLDGLIIPPAGQSGDEWQSGEYLIVFQPNSGHYEDTLAEAKKLGEELNKKVVLFNYRGVGESTGNATNAKDLVHDGRAICQMLMDKGIPASRIMLYGHSIGGGIATAVAAKNQDINLIIDRSFSSLSKAAQDIVSNKTNRVFGHIARYLFRSHGWEINTSKILSRMNNKVLVLTAEADAVLVKSNLAHSIPKNKGNITHFAELRFEQFQPNNTRLSGDIYIEGSDEINVPIEAHREELNRYSQEHVHVTHITENEQMLNIFKNKVQEAFIRK